jgi:hypothetical protein
METEQEAQDNLQIIVTNSGEDDQANSQSEDYTTNMQVK